MLLPSRKSGIAPIVTLTVAITGPTIDRITPPTTATMVGRTIIGPTTTIQGGAEASMQLNSCCNASLPNPSCLAGERRLADVDDLALLGATTALEPAFQGECQRNPAPNWRDL